MFGGLSALLVIDGLTDMLPPELQGIKEQTGALKDFQAANGAILSQTIDGQMYHEMRIDQQVALGAVEDWTSQ